MGPSLNLCQFVGRLGHDAELRYTGKQTPILSFSMAVTMYEGSDQGQATERTEWIQCVIIGKLGEAVKAKMTKGAQLFFSGELRNRKWTGKDGQDRHATEIVNWNRHAHQLVITQPGRTKPESSPAAGAPAPDPAGAGNLKAKGNYNDMDDADLPF